ncbi:pectate lyase [Amaricoccus sp. W119]|uniref:pectate lyase n=1 Tax=Amaricoccus sp. W119 TaxID=3391833 RepID=UPI0039A4B1E2
MRLNAIASILALTIGAAPTTLAAQDNPANAPEITRAVVEEAMKAATRFMVEKVALKGGYVWSYLPDMSKRWGEMEAYDTMVWVQPPGTATMGHLFLDAYHATGDEYYYDAAMETAGALIWGQTEAGGWNYMFDFAGPASLQRWYDTIGEAGWRLEEFHHNWENATFDDAGTAESTQFLLRLYLEKLDPTLRPALDKAIDLIVESQQPIGTWPQRYPENLLWEEDYTSYPTLNDDVASENMETLIMAWQTLGRPDLLPVIHRGMDAFLLLQQGDDQPGFSLQYDADLNPVAARSYEPLALATHTTASALRKLMDFYAMTGDTRYLARVDEGLGLYRGTDLRQRFAPVTPPV